MRDSLEPALANNEAAPKLGQQNLAESEARELVPAVRETEDQTSPSSLQRPHPADRPARLSRSSTSSSAVQGIQKVSLAVATEVGAAAGSEAVAQELTYQSPVLTLDSAGFHGARSPTSAQAAGSLARRVDATSIATSRGDKDNESSAPKPTSEETTTPPRAGPSSSTNGKDGKTSPSEARAQASSVPSSRRQLGEWALGKTLGAGSMGKVKLAVSSTSGEKVAVKIVPRFTSTANVNAQKAAAEARRNSHMEANGRKGSLTPNGSRQLDEAVPEKTPAMPTKSYIARAHAKDLSKEVRTVREASIVLLLHHPYICGMRSMVVYPHHYYMVFEYVNGGQMLDYIISHGRLRERSARKFARQIGSALEYCHANSIVHRDLKIENILISKTGNIKIIDFGLSNLYSPRSQLSTFCGSLYFAAPELLNAKPYTGPEVDIWSFGIVLYVLVCGKVPFDDQSMPALHAKIKRGQVEYPAWLSAECKHLLSRMLVTSPLNRAMLREILSHPWMVKTFEGPPTAHLPPREPLRLGEIDKDVVRGMNGFEFGTPEEIEERLNEVLASEAYCLVLKAYDDRRGGSPLNNSSTLPGEQDGTKAFRGAERRVSRTPSKRLSGLDFLGKKLSSLTGTALSRTSSDGREDSTAGLEPELLAALGGRKPEELDPTRGFDPLLSIYFLVREKIERERIYGAGVFASSTLSVNGPPPPPLPPQAHRQPAQAHFEASRGAIRFSDTGSAPDADRLVASARASASAPNTPVPQQRMLTRRSEDLARVQSEETGMGRAPRPMDGQPTVDAIPEDGPSNSSPASMFSRRFGSLLGRATSISEADYRRHRQRASLGSVKTPASALPQVESLQLPPGLNGGSTLPRASSSGAQNAADPPINGEARHPRGLSLGGLPSTVGNRASRHASLVQRRRPSTTESRVEQNALSISAPLQDSADRVEPETEPHIKPVYLKGLFSVATTSTKSPQTIRSDLQAVLERLGVQYREIKGGFECSHAPSIDLSGGKAETSGKTKRTSRLGLPGNKAGSQTSDLSETLSPVSPAEDLPDESVSSTHMPTIVEPKTLTDTPDAALANELTIRFDIFIVKVPWLPGIHGVQFRRKAGNAWNYSQLARRILHLLKL